MKSMVYGGVLITASSAGSGLLGVLIALATGGGAAYASYQILELLIPTLILAFQVAAIVLAAVVICGAAYVGWAMTHLLILNPLDDRRHDRWMASEHERVARERADRAETMRVHAYRQAPLPQAAPHRLVKPSPYVLTNPHGALTEDERALMPNLDALTRKE